jgi:hypothetical protein
MQAKYCTVVNWNIEFEGLNLQLAHISGNILTRFMFARAISCSLWILDEALEASKAQRNCGHGEGIRKPSRYNTNCFIIHTSVIRTWEQTAFKSEFIHQK